MINLKLIYVDMNNLLDLLKRGCLCRARINNFLVSLKTCGQKSTPVLEDDLTTGTNNAVALMYNWTRILKNAHNYKHGKISNVKKEN